MHVNVETRAGERGERTPQRFELGGHLVEVEQVLDQWPGADHSYVKLRGADGNLYILRLDERAARWELTLFKNSRGEEMRVQPVSRKKRPVIH